MLATVTSLPELATGVSAVFGTVSWTSLLLFLVYLLNSYILYLYEG